jgi:biopolymer transport protein TolR
MAEINVTPFVDVMLVLLIVFMVTAPLLTVGVPVDLPKTDARPLPDDNRPIEVTIDQNGAIFLGDTPVGMAELVARLQAITNNRLDARIYVRGDAALSYGRIMEIVGAINGAGYSKVALVGARPN